MYDRPLFEGAPVGIAPVTFDASGRHEAALSAEAERAVACFRSLAAGVHKRTCSLCDYHGFFSAYGTPPRLDARCAKCASLERHRLFALLIDREGLFGPEDRVLHFAPEHHLRRKIRPLVGRYETADLRMNDRIDHVANIEAMDLPNGAYTRVIANHVLEHVDDAKALAEMHRVLAPGGMALLSAPVIEGWAETYENAAVTTPEARAIHFGQRDHLRFYGRDIRNRIRAAGFAVEDFTATEPDVQTHGLIRGETIFVARRLSASLGE